MGDLVWDECVNVRDLGGLGRIKPGAAVRMEAPHRLTEAGWAAAWAHGVRTFVDLREEGDGDPDAAPRPEGITTVRVPLDPIGTPFYAHWEGIDNLASPLYYPAMLAEHGDRVVAAVRAIATAEPGGVVFHCASGKDRTGLIALALLALAEAPTTDIIADYLLSYELLKPRYDAIGARDQLTAITELLAKHDLTPETSLTATIESLKMPDYLLDNGLTEDELAALRARLIEPS